MQLNHEVKEIGEAVVRGYVELRSALQCFDRSAERRALHALDVGLDVCGAQAETVDGMYGDFDALC